MTIDKSVTAPITNWLDTCLSVQSSPPTTSIANATPTVA